MPTGLHIRVKFKRWDDRNVTIEKLVKELDFHVMGERGPEQAVEGILQDMRFVNLAKGFGNVDEVKILSYKTITV